jgi:hypothetical protein
MRYHRIKSVLCLMAACLLSGCASLSPWSHPIQGQWVFAYVRKAPSAFGELPAPPLFDRIAFTPPYKIQLQSSLSQFDFDGRYKLSDGQLSYTFQPPEADAPVRHEVGCELLDQAQRLILTYDQTEYVYYRPAKFEAPAIAGRWTFEADGETETLQLGVDGSYQLVHDRIVGHYRLWPSRYGQTMTAIVDIPGHGGHLMLYQYQREGDQLALTPISWKGPLPDSTITWTRSAEDQDTPSGQ